MSLREPKTSWLLRIYFHNSYWTKCQNEITYKLTLKDLKRHKGMVISFLIADILSLPFSALFFYSFNKYLLRVYQELGIALESSELWTKQSQSLVSQEARRGQQVSKQTEISDHGKCCEENAQNKVITEWENDLRGHLRDRKDFSKEETPELRTEWEETSHAKSGSSLGQEEHSNRGHRKRSRGRKEVQRNLEAKQLNGISFPKLCFFSNT